jgi:hypothetical protein
LDKLVKPHKLAKLLDFLFILAMVCPARRGKIGKFFRLGKQRNLRRIAASMRAQEARFRLVKLRGREKGDAVCP